MSVDAPLPSAPRLIIDLDAVRANYQLMAEHSGIANTGAAIKADSYGLGMNEIAPLLRDAGCSSFFCAHVSEAMTARQILGHDVEIFVLNGVCFGEAPLMRQKQLIPVLSTPEHIALWGEAGENAPAALHFDTGMNRLGLAFDENIMTQTKDLNLNLLMSHLACASEPAHPLNQIQCKRFEDIKKAYPGLRASLANSAGVLLGKAYHHDLTRPGIALYGGAPLEEGGPALTPVARIEAPILQVCVLKKGETVGYGASFTAPEDMRIATAAIGYADGLPRAASPGGFGRIAGQAVPLIGRVSMDLSVFDVSALTQPLQAGDTVMVLGGDLDALAKTAKTLSYEILTGLGPRFVREYKGNGA